MARLTAIIPCKNERANIQPCIDALRAVADEIIVADSGSTDGTLEIVRSLADVRLIERDYINEPDFKNWCIPHARCEWILFVDADERVTPELAREIRTLLASRPKADGYRARFLNYFLGHPVRYSGWNSTHSLRLMRRDVCRFTDRRVHPDVEIQTGKVGRLKNHFVHYTSWSMEKFLEKTNSYTSRAALDMFEAGRQVTLAGMFWRPVFKFVQCYFVRRGFLDGGIGLIVCMLTAFYAFLKYAKLWALHRGRPQEQVESAGAAANQAAARPAA